MVIYAVNKKLINAIFLMDCKAIVVDFYGNTTYMVPHLNDFYRRRVVSRHVPSGYIVGAHKNVRWNINVNDVLIIPLTACSSPCSSPSSFSFPSPLATKNVIVHH